VHTLLVLVQKEFLQIRRDGLMLRQLFIVPIIQLLVLSSAATFEVKSARVFAVDHDRSATSRGLLNRLQASGRFQLAGASASLERANDAMLSRDVEMIVVLPAGFEKDVVTNRSARVQLIMNAEDGASAGVTHSYAAQIVAGYARELAQRVRPEPDGQGGRSVRAAAAPAVDVRTTGTTWCPGFSCSS
jgi:ABC-2 type transport system permease protein